MGHSWEVALGAVFISGILFLFISIFKLRQWIIESIPMSMRYSIAAGIGFFLALIALKNVGLVVDNPATLVSLGDMTSAESLFTLGGFLLIAALATRGIIGSVMIVIITITVAAFFMGKVGYNGFMSAPPSIAPTLLKMDIVAALDVGMITVIFAFLFVDLFDTSGTLIAISQQGNLLDEDGKLPRIGKALIADSMATVAGAALGTSNTTSYIESGVGISAGGRTGLTAVVTGILFLLALFFAPIASMVPSYATAPALLFVAVLMSANLALVDWKDLTEAVPALVTALMMPFSFSIAEGIAVGFICYAIMKILTGKFEDMTIGVYVISAVFIVKFLFL
jgi:AGZA family xanthine/uracil permease-like MFS transporter